MNKFNSADAATTLLYATSFNILIYTAITIYEPPKRAMLLNNEYLISSFCILFLLFDWAVRVGVPLTFPEHDQERKNTILNKLLKVLLEYCCIFFMVTFIHFFMDFEKLDVRFDFIRNTFTWYLGFNFIWNFFVMFIMEKLDTIPLLKATFTGDLLNLPLFTAYPKLNDFRTKLSKKLNTKDQNTGYKLLRLAVLQKNTFEFVMQIIIFHVILLSPILVVRFLLVGGIHQSYFEFTPKHLLFGSFAIIPLYFGLALFLDNPNPSELSPCNKVIKSIQCLIIYAFIIVIVFSLNTKVLMISTLIEQSILGILISLIFQNKPR